MTVRELVEQLLEFDQDLEVTITDNLKGAIYRGEFDVTEFVPADGEVSVDIDISACDEEE